MTLASKAVSLSDGSPSLSGAVEPNLRTPSITLLSLAPELIQAISHEMESVEDIKSFRLACKQTDQALVTEVLRHITVNINTETSGKELYKLQYFASASEGSSSCLAIKGIRQVDIQSLSPAFDPEDSWAPAEVATLCYEVELQKCLYNALSSVTLARSVRWIPAKKDNAWAHTAVMDALKTLPKLQSLSIELEHCQIEIPFHFFTALRHISVKCVGEDPRHEITFENLIKMISQSPLLESLNIINGDRRRRTFPRSLHQLFERYPGGVPPLRLKHLSLENFLVRLDDQTVMRHLRYLTALSLHELVDPIEWRYHYSGGVDDSEGPISKNIWHKCNGWGSSYEQIWRTISNADLKLEEITLYDIPSVIGLVEYISSYSGLKKLIIGTRALKNRAASDSAGKKFYEALAKHAGSIETLEVDAYYEGLWCFGHHNKALFSTFRNLKTVRVRVQSSDFVLSSDLGRSSRQDIIELLIDTAAIYMPQLRALSAEMPAEMPTWHCFSQDRRMIVARVVKYKAPWGCKRLPMFTTSSPVRKRVFVGQSLDSVKEGETLGYEDVSPPAAYPDSEEDDTDSEEDDTDSEEDDTDSEKDDTDEDEETSG